MNEKPRPGKKPKLTGRDGAMLTAIAFDLRGWRYIEVRGRRTKKIMQNS
ncbi:MAG: hypothetical protein ACXQTD_00225 [Candidatus Syntropharchaeia archaeon]